MGRNWIIDVIADLQSFAEQNELPMLADELTKARTVASVELSATTEDKIISSRGDDTETQRLFHSTRDG